MAREEEHPRVHFSSTATLSLMSIANWMSKTRKSEREEKIQLHYQAKLYYDNDRVKRMLRKKTPHPYDCLDFRALFFPVHWGDKLRFDGNNRGGAGVKKSRAPGD